MKRKKFLLFDGPSEKSVSWYFQILGKIFYYVVLKLYCMM